MVFQVRWSSVSRPSLALDEMASFTHARRASASTENCDWFVPSQTPSELTSTHSTGRCCMPSVSSPESPGLESPGSLSTRSRDLLTSSVKDSWAFAELNAMSAIMMPPTSSMMMATSRLLSFLSTPPSRPLGPLAAKMFAARMG